MSRLQALQEGCSEVQAGWGSRQVRMGCHVWPARKMVERGYQARRRGGGAHASKEKAGSLWAVLQGTTGGARGCGLRGQHRHGSDRWEQRDRRQGTWEEGRGTADGGLGRVHGSAFA